MALKSPPEYSKIICIINLYFDWIQEEIMAKKESEKKHRSAETGKYVSEEFAKKHPKTTVAETEKKHKKK